MRHKKGNFAVTKAAFVQSNLTSHLLYLELSCQEGIVSLSLSKIRLTFVLRIPWRNQNLTLLNPFSKYYHFWCLISHSMLGLRFPFLSWLLSVQPLCALFHLPPHDVDTIRIFSPCTAYPQRLFLLSSLSPISPASICLEESHWCLKSLGEEQRHQKILPNDAGAETGALR